MIAWKLDIYNVIMYEIVRSQMHWAVNIWIILAIREWK